jgi:hypothetical protein
VRSSRNRYRRYLMEWHATWEDPFTTYLTQFDSLSRSKSIIVEGLQEQ